MSKYIHTAFDKEKKKLIIELPRYHLHFEVDSRGQLQCIELAAFVPPKQKLETFYGLTHRLVLQDKGPMSLNPKTWVLVPFGDVNVKLMGQHVCVDIDIDGFDVVKFYKYRVDETLNYLVPDTVEGYLWKAYLHACTSYCLPDDLTGCKGIEEAFRTLDDPLLRTSVPFTIEATQILERIAKLSVCRSFYPNNTARHMQQTAWNKTIPFMMQHDGFHQKINDIACHNYKTRFLYDEDVQSRYVVPAYRGNDKDLVLADRALHMWRKYWPAGFTSGEDMVCGDKPYVSRDKLISRDTSGVFEVATIISSWEISEQAPCDLYNLLHQCQRRASKNGVNPLVFSTEFRPTSLTQLLTLDMGKSWPSLFRYCLDAKETDKTELLFTLSMIVYGNPKLLDSVKILLPFAMMSALKSVGLPNTETCSDNAFGSTINWDHYDLCQGRSIDWNVIEKILDECQVKHEAVGRDQMAQHDGPADVHTLDNPDSRAQRRLLKQAVKSAWSEDILRLPDDDSLNQFEVDLLGTMLAGRLSTWMKNSILKKHCEKWEKILESQVGSPEPLSRPDLLVAASKVRTLPRLAVHHSLLEVVRKTHADSSLSTSVEPTNFDGAIKHLLVPSDGKEAFGAAEENRLHQELEELITAEIGPQDETTRKYRQDLLDSNLALKEIGHRFTPRPELPKTDLLTKTLSSVHQSCEAL